MTHNVNAACGQRAFPTVPGLALSEVLLAKQLRPRRPFSLDLHGGCAGGGEGCVQVGDVGAEEFLPAGEGLRQGFLALVEAIDQVGGGGGVGAFDGSCELLEGCGEAAEG